MNTTAPGDTVPEDKLRRPQTVHGEISFIVIARYLALGIKYLERDPYISHNRTRINYNQYFKLSQISASKLIC